MTRINCDPKILSEAEYFRCIQSKTAVENFRNSESEKTKLLKKKYNIGDY